jgi:hypothetical protein
MTSRSVRPVVAQWGYVRLPNDNPASLASLASLCNYRRPASTARGASECCGVQTSLSGDKYPASAAVEGVRLAGAFQCARSTLQAVVKGHAYAKAHRGVTRPSVLAAGSAQQGLQEPQRRRRAPLPTPSAVCSFLRPLFRAASRPASPAADTPTAYVRRQPISSNCCHYRAFT